MSTRRTFLVAGGAATAVGVAYGWRTWDRDQPDPALNGLRSEPRPPAAPLNFEPFDPLARANLSQLFDDLIPGDEVLPKASDVDVMGYVTAMAASAGFVAVRNRLLKLARWLDVHSRRTFDRKFLDLEDDVRRQVLETADSLMPSRGFQPKAALRLALQAGLEGYLGHPRHRSSQDFGVWETLGVRLSRTPGDRR